MLSNDDLFMVRMLDESVQNLSLFLPVCVQPVNLQNEHFIQKLFVFVAEM